MLKHVVFFKFKKDAPEAGIADVENGLAGLPGTIAEIREFQFGRDVIHSERSYDMALVSAFDSFGAMQSYQVHPAHQAVVAKLKVLCDSILAVDFEY
ncbi:MAG: Dabb family protein [Desulfobacteraceae bacterium]|nr:Dabb family protein [Desulfobacteraceae bacterium]